MLSTGNLPDRAPRVACALPDYKPKRKPKAVEEKRDKNVQSTMLDRFVGKTVEEREEEEEEGQDDVVMNEDGTMGVRVRDAGEVL